MKTGREQIADRRPFRLIAGDEAEQMHHSKEDRLFSKQVLGEPGRQSLGL